MFHKIIATVLFVQDLAGSTAFYRDTLGLEMQDSDAVSASFKIDNIYLKNGQVISGLQRRDEGAALIFADSQGKETAIPKDQITRRFDSKLSLMPENFADIITADDFNNLIAYLLSKRPTP